MLCLSAINSDSFIDDSKLRFQLLISNIFQVLLEISQMGYLEKVGNPVILSLYEMMFQI